MVGSTVGPRKVLVALDFSEPSEHALMEGHAIASASRAKLYVCHSVANVVRVNALFPERNWLDALAVPQLMEAAGDLAERRITELTGRTRDEVSLFVDHGSAESAILRHAEEQAIDLVVVGSHAHGGVHRVLLGSVAERVARYAHCSVLVARRGSGSGAVLATTDFSDPAEPAVAAAWREAKRRGGQLTVLHSLGLAVPFGITAAVPLGATVQLPPRDAIDAARTLALQMLADRLARLGAEGHRLVPEGIAEHDILAAAARLGAELVVVGSRGRTGLARVALGSVAETVTRRASCSVLVVRSPHGHPSAPAPG
jgi:nucleotide-binding universal stress UspA family protein